MINIAAVASMTRLHCAFATRSSCWASAWASWHFGDVRRHQSLVSIGMESTVMVCHYKDFSMIFQNN